MTNKTILLGLRRDLEGMRKSLDDMMDRVDAALDGRSFQGPQTYLQAYDFRDDPEGLYKALRDLQSRVTLVGNRASSFTNRQLFDELSLRAAEVRLYQSQVQEQSQEWDLAVGIIRSLTRIASEHRPGYVYGLASSHHADWGRKIEDIRDIYTPIALEGVPT